LVAVAGIRRRSRKYSKMTDPVTDDGRQSASTCLRAQRRRLLSFEERFSAFEKDPEKWRSPAASGLMGEVVADLERVLPAEGCTDLDLVPHP
jgi:hypothetical protein